MVHALITRRPMPVAVLFTALVAIPLVTPAGALADTPVIHVSGDAPAFWDGDDDVSAAATDADTFARGWAYELEVADPARLLRVSVDFTPRGFRDWADGRGPEVHAWPAYGVTNGPPVWLGAVGSRFTLEVVTPGGERHRSAMTTGYSIEVFVDDPVAGTYLVRVVPQDAGEFAAAVARGEFGRDQLSFRLRAKLGGEPPTPHRGSLLPNLRIVAPFEVGFAIPSYTFGPGVGAAPGKGHGCMAEEHEEYVFEHSYAVGRTVLGEDGHEHHAPAVHCLRFSAGIENVGDGPLVMNAVQFPADPDRDYTWRLEDGFDLPAYQRVLTRKGKETVYVDGAPGSAGTMQYHAFHSHFHYDNAYAYTLYALTPGDRTEVSPSQKGGFNPADEKLADWHSFDQCRMSSRAADAGTGGCAYRASDGMAVLGRGWGDVYEWNRSGQYAAVPDAGGRPQTGEYVLVGVADPDAVIAETDEGDNLSYAHFVITADGVELCSRGYGQGPTAQRTDGASCASEITAASPVRRLGGSAI